MTNSLSMSLLMKEKQSDWLMFASWMSVACLCNKTRQWKHLALMSQSVYFNSYIQGRQEKYRKTTARAQKCEACWSGRTFFPFKVTVNTSKRPKPQLLRRALSPGEGPQVAPLWPKNNRAPVVAYF